MSYLTFYFNIVQTLSKHCTLSKIHCINSNNVKHTKHSTNTLYIVLYTLYDHYTFYMPNIVNKIIKIKCKIQTFI